jgi:hypothetical protein
MRLYRELAPYYPQLTAPDEYAEEAALYMAAMQRAVPDAATLLELGAGAGANASFFKRDVRCTLSDLSDEMLALSRELNPDCEHVLGDMRTLRLEADGAPRRFDLVFVHDAIMYMASEEDLARAIETAAAHCRPGGAALFAPDCTDETFVPGTELFEGSDPSIAGGAELRFLEWCYDPDPNDQRFTVDYAVLIREGGGAARHVFDRHEEGLFPDARWQALLEAAGFDVERVPRDTGPVDDHVYLCRRR